MLSICDKLDCPCPYCPPKQKLLDRLDEFSQDSESEHIRLNYNETKYLYELVKEDLKGMKRPEKYRQTTITDFNDRMNNDRMNKNPCQTIGYGQTFHLDTKPITSGTINCFSQTQ